MIFLPFSIPSSLFLILMSPAFLLSLHPSPSSTLPPLRTIVYKHQR